MPKYLSDLGMWVDFYPIPLFAALVSLILVFVSGEARSSFGNAFLVIFAVALLGIVAGQMTGQSREPAVAAVVPAVLTLLGGLMVYLVAGKSLQQQKATAIAVIAFSFNLLIGTFWGSHLRYEAELFATGEEVSLYREAVRQNVKLERLKYEQQLIEARKILGLPEKQDTEVYVIEGMLKKK